MAGGEYLVGPDDVGQALTCAVIAKGPLDAMRVIRPLTPGAYVLHAGDLTERVALLTM